METEHGGVYMYIEDTINFSVLEDSEDPSFEMLCIKIKPARLPRGNTPIVIGTLYHPPSVNDSVVIDYLSIIVHTVTFS